MYKKILVPLDGSERAEAIMAHVEEMALRYEADVVLIQVVEPNYNLIHARGDTTMTTFDFVQAEIEQRRKEADAYLMQWRGKFAEKGIEVKTIATFGPVVTELLHAAAREGADIIAMSSHGRTGLSRVFYGSIAAGLLHQTQIPLLLVRAETG